MSHIEKSDLECLPKLNTIFAVALKSYTKYLLRIFFFFGTCHQYTESIYRFCVLMAGEERQHWRREFRRILAWS